METKVCTKCGTEKSISEFFKSGFQKSGKAKNRPDCKECASKDTAAWRAKNREHYNKYSADYRTKNPDKFRAIDMKRNYGMTMDQYNKMGEGQGWKCKICKRPPRGKRPLAIDHNHKTGEIRGLLCYRCNHAIAILDDKDHLELALAYLMSVGQ